MTRSWRGAIVPPAPHPERWSDAMADDPTPTVEQLQAQLLALQAQHSVALPKNATLRAHQAATADILHVIASSSTDLQHALQLTAEAGLRIVDAHFVGISQPIDGELQVRASAISVHLTEEQPASYEAARRG